MSAKFWFTPPPNGYPFATTLSAAALLKGEMGKLVMNRERMGLGAGGLLLENLLSSCTMELSESTTFSIKVEVMLIIHLCAKKEKCFRACIHVPI